jgi:lipoprotein-releasing system permease protein
MNRSFRRPEAGTNRDVHHPVLIVLVAAFGIVSTLIMVVMEKNKDIAILKSMGATARSIMRIFIFEGLIIGCVGTLIGLGGGYVVCTLLAKYQFITLPSDVYYISRLPVKMNILDFVLVALSSLGISFLATLYPSWQASRLDPAEPCSANRRRERRGLEC